MAYLMAIMPSDTESATLDEWYMESFMGTLLTILSVMNGIQQARSGNKAGGLAGIFNSFRTM